jgi:hypothetical protein
MIINAVKLLLVSLAVELEDSLLIMTNPADEHNPKLIASISIPHRSP